MSRSLLLGLGFLVVPRLGPAPAAEPCVALVVGNAAYPQAPLANPGNDARAMGSLLRSVGFDVIERLDADRRGLEAAVAEAAARMAGRRATAVFYYAGHGIQVDWRNYLVPVDARPTSAEEVRTSSLDLGSVLEAFARAGTRRNIVLLDACRNNPFRGAASGAGLAQMDAPPGTLLAYATAPGHVADDGSRGNGLYTGHLLQELARPGAKLEDALKRTRLRVRTESGGRQVPWESTSLEDDFCFLPPAVGPAATEAERDQRLEEESAEWARVAKAPTPASLQAFLARHPSGPFSELAQFRLDQLQKVAVLPQPRPGTAPILPSGTNRFRVGDVLEYQETWEAPNQYRGRVIYEVLRTTDEQVDLQVSFLRPDGRVKVIKRQVWDQLGNQLTYQDGSRRSLPWVQVPADLSLGKRWISEFWLTPEEGSSLRRMRISWDLRAVALEPVEGPGGKVRAFKIEGLSTSSLRAPGGTTYWVDPSTFIKLREHTWRKDAAGHPSLEVHRELLAHRRGGATAPS